MLIANRNAPRKIDSARVFKAPQSPSATRRSSASQFPHGFSLSPRGGECMPIARTMSTVWKKIAVGPGAYSRNLSGPPFVDMGGGEKRLKLPRGSRDFGGR